MAILKNTPAFCDNAAGIGYFSMWNKAFPALCQKAENITPPIKLINGIILLFTCNHHPPVTMQNYIKFLPFKNKRIYFISIKNILFRIYFLSIMKHDLFCTFFTEIK